MSMSQVAGTRLSPQQRAMWCLDGRGEQPVSQAVVALRGQVDARRLRGAIDAAVQRHEALRTAFAAQVGLRYPLQVVAANGEVVFRHVTAVDEAARAAATRFAWHDAQAPRSAVSGAALHAWFIEGPAYEHSLVLALPAICCDARSMELCAREIVQAYGRNDARDGADETRLSYPDFAEWQNELEADLPPRLSNELSQLRLAWENPGLRSATRSTDSVSVELSGSLSGTLESFASTTGASLEVIALAALQVQLSRLTGQSDMTLAIHSEGRELEEVRETIGRVGTFQAVALHTADQVTVGDVLRATRRALDGRTTDGVGLTPETVRTAEALQDAVTFACYDLRGASAAQEPAWSIERFCPGSTRAKLAVSIVRSAHHVAVELEFDPERLARQGIEAMLEQYVALLSSMIVDEHARVDTLRMLSADEHANALKRGRAARQPWRSLVPWHATFERHAQSTPDALALVCGEQAFTYRELNCAANRLAHRLLARRVAGDSPVGLLCERSAASIVGMLGILKAGAAYVPLDPRAPSERLSQQMRAAGLSLLVADGKTNVDTNGCDVVELDDPSLELERTDDPGVEIAIDQLASVIFTSGSTGVPKGVAVSHRGMSSYTTALCKQLELEGDLHFATVSTLTADLGNTSIFGALATGGCLHVIDYATATDAGAFAAYARRHPLDVLKIVPSHLSALLETDTGPEVLPRRMLILGGEALPLPLVERIGELAPTCQIVNHYGPTETTVGALVQPLSTLGERRGCLTIPIGRPLANAEAYVLDTALAPAPTGVAGELYLGGDGLSRGYIGRPDLTAERFVPHPFREGARLYRTGDVARYRPDGSIEFLGRRDNQLKIRGFRVELGEIEACIRAHPAVDQAVVLAELDEHRAATIVAYVVVASGAQLADGELRAFLKPRLPDYMVPGEVVKLASLPLTTNGKIDRSALKDQLRVRVRRTYVAPRTPAEQTIARIWMDVLGRSQVSVDDDFFELGGHSLLAIPLMHRIQQALGGSLSLASIFTAPTVAALAALISAGEGVAPVRLRGGSGVPLFCIDPTGQHVAAYQSLADAMGAEQSVRGLEIGSVLGALGSEVSVPSIAERLLLSLRMEQPRGPYRLLGWSFGGVLALALARALEVRGERVDFVGILDTQPRTQLYASGEPDPLDELESYLGGARLAEFRRQNGEEIALLRSRLFGAAGLERVGEAARWAQQHGLLPDGVSMEAFQLRYLLLRSGASFLNGLERSSLKVPVHVWWASETLTRYGAAPEDWQRYTTGPAVVHVVAGDHDSLVHDAAVHGQIAQVLKGLPDSYTADG